VSNHSVAPVGQSRISLNALAGAVVADTAPEQREYFALVTPTWKTRRVPRYRQMWHGGAVGSGVVQVLISDIIYPVLAGVFTQLLGDGAVAGWRWWRSTRRRGTVVDGTTRLPISTDAAYLAEFRSVFLATCASLDIPGPRAAVLADAAVGILIRTAAADTDGPSGDAPTAP
jgi:hypothetical protein